MPDAWPPQPDVFSEAPPVPLVYATLGWPAESIPSHVRWNSDDEWTVARVHASWHGRRHPEDDDLAFARAVLAELH